MSDLSTHKPWVRITTEAATATDRHWLAMLDDVFESADFDFLRAGGVSQAKAIEFLGVIALRRRICGE